MERILALDPGEQTGWALGERDGAGAVALVESGTLRWGKDRPAAADAYSRWLSWALGEWRVGRLIVENPIGGRFLEMQFTHWSVVQAELICHRFPSKDREILFRPVNVTTLKRHAAGKARARDMEMLAAARRWGFDPKTSHEAVAQLMLVHCLPDPVAVAAE